MLAAQEAEAGDNQLAEYCSRQSTKLEEVVAGAVSVIVAGNPNSSRKRTLVQKLQAAAQESPCECNGLWAAGAVQVLRWNGISVESFTNAVLKGLRFGAKRGANVACVGEGG